jgi:hypothetical protein
LRNSNLFLGNDLPVASKPMLERLKQLANKSDVSYQSLLKMFVAHRLNTELGSE